MGKTRIILVFFICSLSDLFAQPGGITCPSPYVFMDGGNFISYYDPSQPLSANNPANTNIPTFGGGLTLMPNINGGTLSPTFYTTSGGNYYYWSGSAWVNTGHSTGNGAAVNLGGCNGKIYNLVGASGTVYSYDGTSNGTQLTVLQNFNGGGPYDLVTDCNCNFYALNTSNPNQGLTMYNSAGVPQCTYSLQNMPNTSAGGGFAIIGNTIYVKNNLANGFFIGTIGAGVVTFTQVNGFNMSPGDFASCPNCTGNTGNINASISAGIVSCNNPTTNLIVTTTASPVSYNWTGPGIIGSTTNSFIIANAPGIYSCTVYGSGCPPSQVTLVSFITSNTVQVAAAITPSGTVCMNTGGATQLVATHQSSTDLVVWTGPGMAPVYNTNSITVNTPGSYTLSVTDIYSGCTGTDVVHLVQTPTVNLALSDFSMCAEPHNGSPNTLTLTASGALNYTLLTDPNYTVSSPSPSVFVCTAVGNSGALVTTAHATLIGSSGSCYDDTHASFNIIQNPTITLSPNSGSMCPYQNVTTIASGASSYVWTGPPGLNTYVGSQVVATPTASSVYGVIGSGSGGCKSTSDSLFVTVLPIPNLTITPATSTMCLGSMVILQTAGNAASFNWSPSSGLSSITNPVVNASPSTTKTYTVIGTLNTCTNSASATVYVEQPPVISLTMNTPSMCAQNFNSSPNAINVLATGANSYTISGGPEITILNPSGPFTQIVPALPYPTVPTAYALILQGKTGLCTVNTTKTFEIVPNPVVTLNPPTASICPGQAQLYTAAGATTYSWLPAPNYTLISPSVIITKPNITTYYSVFGSSAGCRSSSKNAITVLLPVPTASIISSSGTVCAGSSVTFSALSTGNMFTWLPPSAYVSSGGTVAVSIPVDVQTYTLISNLNTCTNSAVITITSIPIPSVSLSASDPTVCSGSLTHLYAKGANWFDWSPPFTLNHPAGSAVIAHPDVSTTYTVNGFNGVCTGSATIFIRAIERPNLKIEAPENAICYGHMLPMSVSGAQTYSWMPAHGLFFITDSTVKASPTISTNYTVVGATSLGSVTCPQQLSYFVTVIPTITPSVSENTNICIGQKTTLSAGGGNTFKWAPAYGLNTTQGSKVIASPTVSTVYTVEVSHDTYCGVTTTLGIEVNPRPEVFAGSDTTYNISEAIFINAIGTGTINWVFGEGILCADCPFTQIYPTRNGCYTAEAINEFGCINRDQVCITLTEDFTIYIPNVFTPNKDGLNDVFEIYGTNISNVTMEIFDRWGVLIYSSNDYTIGWDGTYKGVQCPLDTYNYKVTYTGLDRKRYIKTGYVLLAD